MKNRKRSLIAGAVLLFVLIVAGAGFYSAESVTRHSSVSASGNRSANSSNRHLVDSGISLLRTGDVVVRTGADVTSYMFTQMNQHNKTYSHCGLVVVEQGYPFIYHCIGGEDNPNEKLRRDSARFWFSPANNLGFGIVRYSLDTAAIGLAVHTARQYFLEQRRFDMDFDLETDDRLYCAEFLYKLLNRVTDNDSFIKPSRMFGYSFVGIDNLFLNAQARFICQVRYK